MRLGGEGGWPRSADDEGSIVMLIDGGGGGYSGHRIYQMVQPNTAYSESMEARSLGTRGSAKAHDDAAVELAGIMGSLNESWRGKAAEGAKGELEMLQKISADAASSNLVPAGSSMEYQSTTHAWARNTLEPMEESPKQANVVERIFSPSTQKQYNAEWSAKNSYNIDVYSGYSDATTANTDALSKEFPKVPESKWTELKGPKVGNKIGGEIDDPNIGGGGGTHTSSSGGGESGGGSGSGSGGGGTGSGGGGTGGGGGGTGGGAGGGGEQLPGGGVRLPDGSIRYPDGTIVYPDGSKKLPDGTIVYPDGTKKLPNGTIIKPDGTIIRPNGQVIPPGNTSSAGASSSGSDAATGLLAGGGSAAGAGAGAGSGSGGGMAGAGGFGPGGGSGSGAGAGMGAGKGMGGVPAAGAGGMGKGAGGMGARGGMGGMMGGGGGGGRGQGGDDGNEHKDQYFIKQELDPGLHVEYDEFGEKLIDDSTGLTVVPPVIGE